MKQLLYLDDIVYDHPDSPAAAEARVLRCLAAELIMMDDVPTERRARLVREIKNHWYSGGYHYG